MRKSTEERRAVLPRTTLVETIALLAGAGGPLLAKGIIIRRPWVVRLLEATGAEGAGVEMLQQLRRRYGNGPLMLRVPFRQQAILLSPGHVRRVLAETPDPFEPDSSEKHATLAHFEPNGSLISRGADRQERRDFNERVLEPACPVHSLFPRLEAIVAEEAATLLAHVDREKSLDWGSFKDGWFRVARRALFGDHAAGDTELTSMHIRLRGDANWAFAKPKRKVLRARFLSRIASHLHRAGPASLGQLALAATTPRAAPEDQIAQWLFAFDAAGIAAFRALAVLASSAPFVQRARQDTAPGLPFLRACLLESVRLWPTTPAILRQTSADTDWDGVTMLKGTGVLIHVPFLHRDDERLPFAHRFAPEVWIDGNPALWPLVPFSGGPGECPAKNLVLMLAGLMLRGLVDRHDYELPSGKTLDASALPPTFDQFSLVLRASPMR